MDKSVLAGIRNEIVEIKKEIATNAQNRMNLSNNLTDNETIMESEDTTVSLCPTSEDESLTITTCSEFEKLQLEKQIQCINKEITFPSDDHLIKGTQDLQKSLYDK